MSFNWCPLVAFCPNFWHLPFWCHFMSLTLSWVMINSVQRVILFAQSSCSLWPLRHYHCYVCMLRNVITSVQPILINRTLLIEVFLIYEHYRVCNRKLLLVLRSFDSCIYFHPKMRDLCEFVLIQRTGYFTWLTHHLITL